VKETILVTQTGLKLAAKGVPAQAYVLLMSHLLLCDRGSSVTPISMDAEVRFRTAGTWVQTETRLPVRFGLGSVSFKMMPVRLRFRVVEPVQT
jgi:hypothetical protein